MSTTLYLDPKNWDLVLDSFGNWAQAAAPYQLAQDAASAIRTFLGEVYFDTTIGVDYWGNVLGQPFSLALLKQVFADAAMTVPGIVSAAVFITDYTDRTVTGQVQVTDAAGVTSVASF